MIRMRTAASLTILSTLTILFCACGLPIQGLSNGSHSASSTEANSAITPKAPWIATYSTSPYDQFDSVAIVGTGDTVAVGCRSTSDSLLCDSHTIVARFDAGGALVWARTYGGNKTDKFFSVAVGSDGTIFAAGWTASTDGDFPPAHGSTDAIIAAINPTDGSLKWARTYGGDGATTFWSIAVTSDGTVIAVGHSNSVSGTFPPTSGGFDAAIAAINPTDGTPEWTKTYGGSGQDEFDSVAVAPNNAIIATLWTDSTYGDFPAIHGQHDAGIATINPVDGTLEWARTYGGSDDDIFTSVAINQDGNIVAAGSTDSTDGEFPATHAGNDAVVATIEPSNGTLEWARTYGGSGNDSFTSVAINQDGNIVAAGSTDSTDGDFANATDTPSAVLATLTADGRIH